VNRLFNRTCGGLLLPLAALVLAGGCASLPPAARRDALFNQRQYPSIRKLAVEDLAVLGHFDRAGRIGGRLETSSGEYDAKYFDMAEEVRNLAPQAYHDIARVSLSMGRYVDAIRAAQNAIESGDSYLSGDEWVFLRIMSLRENHKVLYESYLYCGDLDKAAAHHRQYLLMSELVNSQAFKKVMANSLRIRMTSMRMRSEYLARQAGATRNQILVAALMVAAAAGGASGNNNNNSSSSLRALQAAQVAQIGVLAIAMLEEYKQALRVQLNVDLANLMRQAADLSRLPKPTAEDIRRAKMASSIYMLARISDPANALDQVAFSDLKKMSGKGELGVTLAIDDKGRVHVSGDLAKLVELSKRIDEVPMRLPPPPDDAVDAYLDKYLTPGLYRMAGLQMSTGEKDFFDRLVSRGGEDFVIDPAQAEGQIALQGLHKMMQKTTEFQSWVADL
jgi:tetratricopeptide (TPR) repeat protein